MTRVSKSTQKANARTLSKSELMALRQCPKRLWLEVHHPELSSDAGATGSSVAALDRVGETAHRIYDPKGKGVLVDRSAGRFAAAFTRTRELLDSPQPIFEAGFRAEGAQAFADVLLPTKKGGKRGWRMVEVKSSTEVKDYQRDDVAVQSFVARAAGAPLSAVALAHVDNAWVYPGGGDYDGLLVEEDLTEEALGRTDEVRGWIADGQRVTAKEQEPRIATGPHCTEPYACSFLAYCQGQERQAEHPVEWLPGHWSRELSDHVKTHHVTELHDVPDALLNDRQRRVKLVTLSGLPYFDKTGAARALAACKLPAYFLDFETINYAVPIWKGMHPYQQVPFQFSVHRLGRTGELEQQAFLDLSGADPSRGCAEALIATCGERGPVFAYSAGFEKGRIKELAQRQPRFAKALLALRQRVVDLLPVARDHYYHPSQHGSWSIKAVLPALCPDLSYEDLDGVQNGGMAMDAYLEAVAPETSKARKAEIERQLLTYCALDTFAMVRLWSAFTGHQLKG